MGRTAIAIVAAVASAVAIGVVIALRAPTGNAVVELPARDSAPSASELPVTRGEGEMDTTGRATSSDAHVGQKSAAEDVQAGTSTGLNSSPIQQRADAASVRAAAAVGSERSGSDQSPAANPVAEPALSAQEVHAFFLEGDACDVLGRDAKGKERCEYAGALAEAIMRVPKSSEDSWAYGMEHELDRRLTELFDARDLRVLKRTAVHCNVIGCLVYVEGPSTFPGKFKYLIEQIRNDPDIAGLNRQGKWPGAGTWDHGVNRGAMLVMPR